ncbi:MAG: dienelactone hydrolase family protein [Bacteroidota bacterium]
MEILDQSTINIRSGNVYITGDLVVPANQQGLVLFSHGSGSSRFSQRNRFVAEALQRKGFATFLVDLLTVEEDYQQQNRFDISLLTVRLLDVVRYFSTKHETAFERIGLFGASTGAASALRAAAILGKHVFAVVGRGGRPDLAWDSLEMVECPTMMLVGGADTAVLELNKRAMLLLRCEKELHVVPGATHLFEEPGALEEVAKISSIWFSEHVHSQQPEYGVSR